MFCFKCGNEIPDESEFCMKCGTKIQMQQNENSSDAKDKDYPQITCGTHKGNLCELTINSDKITISKKPLVKTIVTDVLFSDIIDVKFYPPIGLNLGSLLIITTNNLGDYKLDKSQFAVNPYVINFVYKSSNEFSQVYTNLLEIAKYNGKQDLIEKIASDEKNAMNEKQAAKERIKENKKNAVACCPKCGSTSLSANKQGFGIGKAIIGARIAKDSIGLAAGNINAKKIHITCLNCGHRWKM